MAHLMRRSFTRAQDASPQVPLFAINSELSDAEYVFLCRGTHQTGRRSRTSSFRASQGLIFSDCTFLDSNKLTCGAFHDGRCISSTIPTPNNTPLKTIAAPQPFVKS